MIRVGIPVAPQGQLAVDGAVVLKLIILTKLLKIHNNQNKAFSKHTIVPVAEISTEKALFASR